MKISSSFTEQSEQRLIKHWISNNDVTKSFYEQKSSFYSMAWGNFCELGFYKAYNNNIIDIRFFSCMNCLVIRFSFVRIYILNNVAY